MRQINDSFELQLLKLERVALLKRYLGFLLVLYCSQRIILARYNFSAYSQVSFDNTTMLSKIVTNHFSCSNDTFQERANYIIMLNQGIERKPQSCC